jgi:signal transduction histidine kinase
MPGLARPHRHDVWIAVAGLLGGLIGIVFNLHVLSSDIDPSPPMLVGLLAMCGAELLRRTAPSWALLLGLAALIVDGLSGGLIAVVIMFTDVVYATVLYGSPRLSRVVLRLSMLVTAMVTAAALAVWREPEALLIGLAAAGCLATPAWTALMIRDHRDTAAAARLRAEQTALLAEMDRVQAVNAERARMARELHDMVANHLSAIAIHATAALSIDGPSGTTRDALTVIRENSTQGLAEMRRLIGLLRHTGGGKEPEATPRLEGLDALLGQAGRNGAASQLRFTRRDARDGAPDPPAPVELAAYRIVQESVTNAVKHAAPGEVTVSLDQDAEALVVTVTSAYDERSAARAPGSGAGLTGMRERVELLDGCFDAGPVPGPGGATQWRVRAELPVAERTRERTARG